MSSTVKASTIQALLSGLPSKVAAIAAMSVLVGGAFTPSEAQSEPISVPASEPTVVAQAVVAQATRAIEDAASPIGIAAGQSLMNEAEAAISAQDYTTAASKLVEARSALNDVSTHYQNLSGTFLGVDSRVSKDLRDLALSSAQVRDQASYQLAVVYRAQSRPDLAVPLLVEVVQSQQPTRSLGQQAFQQLYELGFVTVPYDAPGS